MLRYFRSSLLEKLIKSDVKFLLISDRIIEKFKFLLPYEEDWYFFKNHKISKSSTIIDIGAHWGESAITFSKFYPHNKIISFEPNIFAFQRLKKNTKNLKIKIFNYGIGKKKFSNLYFPYYKNCQLSLWGSQNLKKLKKRIENYTYLNNKKLKYRKLKFFFKNFPHINNKISIIKIDVEGEELNVIKMIKNVIKKNKPLLFIEHNVSNFDQVNLVLKKLGYKSYYFDKNNLNEISKITNIKNLFSLKKKRTINIIFKI